MALTGSGVERMEALWEVTVAETWLGVLAEKSLAFPGREARNRFLFALSDNESF